MEVTAQDIKESLDPVYQVQDIDDDGFKVEDKENGDVGVITFGIDDGNAYMKVNSWTGKNHTVYEGDSETDSFMDARVLDEVLKDEEIEDIGGSVGSILSNGMKQAYEQNNKNEQADTLLRSAHRAYDMLEEQGKGIGRVSFDAEKEGPLGNAVFHYGNLPDDEDENIDTGIHDVKVDMEDYKEDRGFATSATYIMGAVLLNESGSNMKPQVSTEMGYKNGSQDHDTQEVQADTELVETASEMSQYDFLN